MRYESNKPRNPCFKDTEKKHCEVYLPVSLRAIAIALLNFVGRL